jgi:predicted TIM-barrel fold metal-dependent hydrolase
MKIDIFNHFYPKQFFDRYVDLGDKFKDLGKRVQNIPMIKDLDLRFRTMDRFGEYQQFLSLPAPQIEVMASPDRSPELAQVSNDGFAELVQKYPQRFPGFAASLPMNNPEAAVKEIDRAVTQLGARAMQIYTNVGPKPLDDPEFLPIFEAAARHDLTILMHPARGANFPDYLSEDKSKYEIWWTLGWPYETSVAMSRMVFSGFFERWPKLRVVTHHMGGMIPYFEGRVGHGWDQLGSRTSDVDYKSLLKSMKKRPIDYLRMFYADTALFGAAAGTRCGFDFFGEDNVVFASDTPFEPEPGIYIHETIELLDRLEVTKEQRDKIYFKNAKRLLKL